MKNLGGNLRRILGARRGISSVEYALLLAIIGGGIAIGAGTLTSAISGEMTRAANCISGDGENCPSE